MREKRWTSAQKNRLLNEAVAGIPTNRKTTDGGIMGDSGRECGQGGLACSAAEKKRVGFVLKGEKEEEKSER